MALKKGDRIGGRGCPSCGSHDTEGLGGLGAQWCHSCNHRWLPCTPGCRGYRLEPEGPSIRGCVECGVPDGVAKFWPEAWRAMANRLQQRKREAMDQ